MSHFYIPKIISDGYIKVIDDGVNVKFSYGSLDLFRIRKSDGQMQVKASYDSDVEL